MRKILIIALILTTILSIYSEIWADGFGSEGAFGSIINFLKRVTTSIIPSTTATYDLGSASKTWKTIYVDTITSSGLPPVNATYLTSTANGSLTAEVDLGSLSTGFLYGTVAGGISTISSISSTGTGTVVLANSPTFSDDIQLGLAGASGQLKLYSEQGVTDYTATLNPNASMTSAANFYLPADEPAGTYLLNMTTGGVMGYDSSVYLTAEVDGSITNELQNIFQTLAVSGQDSVVADTTTDTLTLAGGGITAITTNATSDTITFTSTEVDGSTTNEINTITLPDANVTAGLGITFAQAGIMGITESAPDTITFTATEADTLDTVADRNATTNNNLTLQKADPSIVYQPATAIDTPFWSGVQEDAAGDDDDKYQIGDGTTPGTNPFLTIDTSGNVGIGTTSPKSLLEVYKTTSAGTPPTSGITPNSSFAITSGTNNNLYIGQGQSGTNYAVYLQVSDGGNLATNYPLALNPNGGTVGIGYTNPGTTAALTINGNVGIGTTGPLALLDVYSTGTSDTRMIKITQPSLANGNRG